MAIAEELVRRAVEIAEDSGGGRVLNVEVELGELRLVQPEAMRQAFSAAAEGSVASGAELRMREVPSEARCRSCGRVFRPEVGVYVCPACGEADAEVTAGSDIVLVSVELEERSGDRD